MDVCNKVDEAEQLKKNRLVDNLGQSLYSWNKDRRKQTTYKDVCRFKKINSFTN